VPRNGQSLHDLNEPARSTMEALAGSGDTWRVPPNPSSADTAEEDLDWLSKRRVPMPIKCFQMGLKLANGEPSAPRSYIYAKRITPADTFGQFAARARSEPGWRYFEIDASHSPNVTAPTALMKVLREIAG
jgi:hypothetical protein